MGNTYNVISWAGWIIAFFIVVVVGLGFYFDKIMLRSEVDSYLEYYEKLAEETKPDTVFVEISVPDTSGDVGTVADIVEREDEDPVIRIDTSTAVETEDGIEYSVVYDDNKITKVFSKDKLTTKTIEGEYFGTKIEVISAFEPKLIAARTFIKWDKINEYYNRVNIKDIVDANTKPKYKMSPLLKYSMLTLDAFATGYVVQNIVRNDKASTIDYITGGLVAINVGYLFYID